MNTYIRINNPAGAQDIFVINIILLCAAYVQVYQQHLHLSINISYSPPRNEYIIRKLALPGIPDIIRITEHQRGVVVIIIPVPPLGSSVLNGSPEYFYWETDIDLVLQLFM